MVLRDSPWLEKTYNERRQRTVELTTRAVAQIRLEKGRVSLSKIVEVSKRLDEKAKGVSSSAVLSNLEAYAIYVAARDWKRVKTISSLKNLHPFELRIKSERDERSLRVRLRKLTKDELIDRLINLEASFSEMQKLIVGVRVGEVKKIIAE